jgi:NTE family protein
MKLLDLLSAAQSGFALAMAPGFFRKFMYVGTLQAMEESNLFNLKAVGGSSAGAIVSGFLACGLKPSELSTMLFDLDREDFWDPAWAPPLLFGFLTVDKMMQTFESKLLYRTFEACNEQCNIRMGVTAYDVFRRKTRVIKTGQLSRAMAASCSVPVMFQPVWIDYSPHIDGGIYDSAGIMALPCPFDENGGLVVNILCAQNQLPSSVLPPDFPETTTLLTIVIQNAHPVTPFTMKDTGPKAHRVAREAM